METPKPKTKLKTTGWILLVVGLIGAAIVGNSKLGNLVAADVFFAGCMLAGIVCLIAGGLIVAGVTISAALLGVIIFHFSFPVREPGLVGCEFLGSIAVGLYIGNLMVPKDAEVRRWCSALLFFVHTGLWIIAISLLFQSAPAEKIRLSDFSGSIPVLTKLVFAAESQAGIILLFLSSLLLAVALISFRRGVSRRRRWVTQAVALVPVLVADVFVFVGLVVGEVAAIN